MGQLLETDERNQRTTVGCRRTGRDEHREATVRHDFNEVPHLHKQEAPI